MSAAGRMLLRAVLPQVVSTLHRQALSAPLSAGTFLLCHRTEQCKRSYHQSTLQLQKNTVEVTFKFQDGAERKVDAKVGDNLLDIVLEHDVDIDGFGACEGTLACSTCHLIFSQEDFAKIPDQSTDEELDMLDLAYGLSDTSRLGCQVVVTKEMDGMVVKVPEGVSDARSEPL